MQFKGVCKNNRGSELADIIKLLLYEGPVTEISHSIHLALSRLYALNSQLKMDGWDSGKRATNASLSAKYFL